MSFILPPDTLDSGHFEKNTSSLRPVLLQEHHLKKKNFEAIPFEPPTIIWPGLITFFILALFVFSYVSFFKKVKLWNQALFSLQYARTLEREDFKALRQPSFSMSLSFFLSAAFFMFQVNRELLLIQTGSSALYQFLVLVIFLLSFFLLKLVVNRIFGHLANEERIAAEYNFNWLLSIQGMGIFLIPVIICLQFIRVRPESFLITGSLIICVFFVVQLVKGVGLALGSRSVSAFHVFLYLCGVEILPLFLLCRLFVFPF